MNDFFTGNYESLREYWENKERAIKFLKGQSRSNAVKHVIKSTQKLISGDIWIDVATGAGFVQTLLHFNKYPSHFIGVDQSFEMLHIQQNPIGSRIQASLYKLPIRKLTSGATSIFFSLSDYPDLDPGLKELFRVTKKSFIFVDYADNDEYWIQRKKLHNKEINGIKVVGNINLRSIDEIYSLGKKYGSMVHKEVIQYMVDTKELVSPFINKQTIQRSFLFLIFNK